MAPAASLDGVEVTELAKRSVTAMAKQCQHAAETQLSNLPTHMHMRYTRMTVSGLPMMYASMQMHPVAFALKCARQCW